jgi:hypothetical protein
MDIEGSIVGWVDQEGARQRDQCTPSEVQRTPHCLCLTCKPEWQEIGKSSRWAGCVFMGWASPDPSERFRLNREKRGFP